MTADNLTALPVPAMAGGSMNHDDAGFASNYAHRDYYTADQMRAYGAALAAANGERES